MSGWMLAFDASAPRTCVALGRLDESEPRYVDEEAEGANQTSERLHERLASVLEAAQLRPRELALLACGRGPGTFTGTRVCVALAKGLALGASLPIVPVSTLASLAASAEHPGHVLALLDARRNQVYGALFDCRRDVRAISDERALELPLLLEELGPLDPDTLAHGPGVDAYASALPATLPGRGAAGPSARGCWRASLAAQRAGSIVGAGELEVRYLRLSYAEMGISTPKRPRYHSPFA